MESSTAWILSALDSLVDKQVLVMLRDGRKIIGIMRSYDQFANIILQDASERLFAPNGAYADIPRGVFVIRGENVVCLGEISAEKERLLQHQHLLYPAPLEQVLMSQLEPGDGDSKQRLNQIKERLVHARGWGAEMENEAF